MVTELRTSASFRLSSRGFGQWTEYFRANGLTGGVQPWSDPYRLSEEEKLAIRSSIQQFQLGEGSDGHHFRRRAEEFCRANGEESYLEALSLFIAEEQRHSADLQRFMERQSIPVLETHWVDGAFRRLRKIAGLELCVLVLVMAEIIAVPYYRALRDATESPLLRSLCARILQDEAAHLRFQAATIAMVQKRHGPLRGRVSRKLHRLLLTGAAIVVWQQHRSVFTRAGYSLRRFGHECFVEIEALYRDVGDAASD